jgi:hypothetical protein
LPAMLKGDPPVVVADPDAGDGADGRCSHLELIHGSPPKQGPARGLQGQPVAGSALAAHQHQVHASIRAGPSEVAGVHGDLVARQAALRWLRQGGQRGLCAPRARRLQPPAALKVPGATAAELSDLRTCSTARQCTISKDCGTDGQATRCATSGSWSTRWEMEPLG